MNAEHLWFRDRRGTVGRISVFSAYGKRGATRTFDAIAQVDHDACTSLHANSSNLEVHDVLVNFAGCAGS